MPSRMLYHASATCASGNLTLPVQETMPTQAGVSLPLIGGIGSASVEQYTYRNVFYMEYGESSVVGSYSARDQAHGTASMAIIEGLNIMDVVTCDRIVARVTTKHPQGAQPSIIPMGSLIEGLRVTGHAMTPVLSVDLFTQYDTWAQLKAAYQGNPNVRAQLDAQSFYKGNGKDLPESKGIFGCTLVRDWGPLPPGTSIKDQGLYVPHFGTIFLGEFYVSERSRNVLMIHVDLGCSTEGCFGGGGAGGNGGPWP